jgi:hypothetical protein
MPPRGERWPPVYDADSLVSEINRLTGDERLEREFFFWRRDRSAAEPQDICQGDIITLQSDVPVLLADGQPAGLAHPGGSWLVIGNTCDFDRSLTDARWTQLVPILDLGPIAEATSTELNAARRYTQSRRFYLPPWSLAAEVQLHTADFLRPVAVDKRALNGTGKVATLEARMSRAAWVLLNACLVRFLARDDGRYDEKAE